jgi:hypothetical protein
VQTTALNKIGLKTAFQAMSQTGFLEFALLGLLASQAGLHQIIT